MAFGFSGGSAENIRPRPPLREDFAIIREEPNLRIAFADNPEEEYEVERLDSQGDATVVGSSSSPDILVPSQAQEHRVVAKNKELGIRGTPSVPKKELKPTHRWQMPQPRNLLDDPESFDPGSTDWNFSNNTTYSTADNVGPSGETAAHLDRSAENNDGFFIIDKSISYIPNSSFTAGIFVRAVSGSGEIKFDFTTDAGVTAAVSPTITTEWEWITVSAPPADSATEVNQVRIYDPGVREIYILRAVLNRGSSRLFSTRSEVPQEIPDVVQGADLSNGSTDSADTNDLDFGVDSQGVPYAVSGGDDRTEEIPSSALGGTWAARIYLALGSRVNIYLGDRNSGRWDIVHVPGQSRLLVRLNDVDGNSYFAVIDTGLNEPGWNTVVATLDESTNTIRFNVNGNTTSVTTTADFKDQTFPLLNVGVTSGRVQHVEKHPVLTPAEAEAVRQRLATNPADPVAPTEAWDFTAETNPHNLIPQSEDITGSDWDTKRSTATAGVTTDPEGNTTADELADNGRSFPIVRVGFGSEANRTVALVAYLKANASDKAAIRVDLDDGNSNFAQYLQPFDLAAGSIGTGFYSTDQGYIVDGSQNPKMQEVGNGWYRCYISVELQNGGFLDFHGIELLDSNGDRISNTQASNNTYSVYVWGNQVVYGDDPMPPYVQTGSSIAFPQTVPAKNDPANDLTLGSTSGADTSDPSWVAPIGLVGDGSDDKLSLSSFHNAESSVTWVLRHELGLIAGDRKRNGWDYFWDGSGFKLSIRDINKDQIRDKSSDPGWAEGEKHVLAVVIDFTEQTAHLYGDTILSPLASVDFSTLSELQSGRFPLHRFGLKAKTSTHAHVYTRALTDEEALYARQRILDNPQSPHPEYTNP